MRPLTLCRYPLASKVWVAELVILATALGIGGTGAATALSHEPVKHPMRIPRDLPQAGYVTNAIQLPFMANTGEHHERVRFYVRTFFGTVFVTDQREITYSLPGRTAEGRPATLGLTETFVGWTGREIGGRDQVPVSVSSFRGADWDQRPHRIPAYRVLDVDDIYPGIDLRLKAYGDNVEKLFLVRAGAHPADIRITLGGANRLNINTDGELEVETELGVVTLTRPVAYQREDGKTRFVDVAYVIRGTEYGFTLGDYDEDRALVIDPLLAGTFLGGSGLDGHLDTSMALDAEGNVYVAGRTQSSDFPATPGAYATAHGGGDDDLFVAKLDPSLSTLLAATFLGGTSDDGGFPGVAIAVRGGNVYVTGKTTSDDFPTTAGAYDPEYHAGEDVFVARLSDDLQSLLSSTMLGGGGDERYAQLTTDEVGGDVSVYVVGSTSSTDFPTTPGAYSRVLTPGGHFGFDVFVAKFNEDLSNLLASTFLGGGQDDFPEWVAVNDSGKPYLVGWTASGGAASFPTTPGAYREDYRGGSYDAFVSRFNNGLTDLEASTFVGGSNWDFGYFLAIDESHNVYITGHTASLDFPRTIGAFDESYNGAGVQGVDDDVFVTRLNGDLSALLASTFLGGDGWENGFAITLTADGSVFVAGDTGSPDFPTSPGAFCTRNKGRERSGFVSKFDTELSDLEESTFLGGAGGHNVGSMVMNISEQIYVVGCTDAPDFPTTPGSYDPEYNGGAAVWQQEDRGGDVFVAKLDELLSADCDANGIPDPCDLDCGSPGGACDVPGCGASTDNDGDNRLDHCCGLADTPDTTTPPCAKNRYLTLVPGNAGRQTAMCIWLDERTSPEGIEYSGEMWVGAPLDVSEASGNSGDAPPPTFQAARLQCAPHCMDWGALPEVHVFDDEIVPGVTYAVQAVDCECVVAEDVEFSPARFISMSRWGDVVGDCSVTPCLPPNGTVDFIDISAVVDKFRNLPGAPDKARADVSPAVPDRVIDFVDISYVVDSFRGNDYPFPFPEWCP